MDSQSEASIGKLPILFDSSPYDLPCSARSPLSKASEQPGMPGVTQAWKRGAVETVSVAPIRTSPGRDLESPALMSSVSRALPQQERLWRGHGPCGHLLMLWYIPQVCYACLCLECCPSQR